jgi:hypothetical protein
MNRAGFERDADDDRCAGSSKFTHHARGGYLQCEADTELSCNSLVTLAKGRLIEDFCFSSREPVDHCLRLNPSAAKVRGVLIPDR